MIIAGLPHHVTQRGNRREPIFFEAGDEAVYLDLMSRQLRRGLLGLLPDAQPRSFHPHPERRDRPAAGGG